MTQFDSLAVQELVQRARLPLDVGVVRRELVAALDDATHTSGDRAQMLVAYAVASQASLPAQDLNLLLDEAVDLLRKAGDGGLLRAALGMSGSLHAAAGDVDRCLDRCLDLLSLTDPTTPESMDPRASTNFGVALISLGAHELAAEHLERAVAQALDGECDVMPTLIVGGLNLSLAIAGLTVLGDVAITDPSQQRRAELVLAAMERVSAEDLGEQQLAFVHATVSFVAQLRGDLDLAVNEWGDLDALSAHPGDSFTKLLCMIEAPLALHRGDIERAELLLDRSLEQAAGAETVLYRRYVALQLRAELHERSGRLAEAMEDLRDAISHLASTQAQLPDLLIRQVDRRAELERSRRELLDHTIRLAEQALVDQLSGVANRRALEIRFDELRSSDETDVVLLVVDIDRFKTVNDVRGHAVGDEIIAGTGRILRGACGESDQIFRYGGDEFVVVAETGSLTAGLDLAERIHHGFAHETWTDLGPEHAVTVSIGVGHGRRTNLDDVFAEADAQLYEAKDAGRSRTRPLPSDELVIANDVSIGIAQSS